MLKVPRGALDAAPPHAAPPAHRKRLEWLNRNLEDGTQVLYDESDMVTGSNIPFIAALAEASSRKHPGLNLEAAASPAKAVERALQRFSESSTDAVRRFIVAHPPDNHSCYYEFMRHGDGKITVLVLDTVATEEAVDVYRGMQEAALANQAAIHGWTYMLTDVQRAKTGCDMICHGFAKASLKDWESFQLLHQARRAGEPGFQSAGRAPRPDAKVLFGGIHVFFKEAKIFPLLSPRVIKNAQSSSYRKKYYQANPSGEYALVSNGGENIETRLERKGAAWIEKHVARGKALPESGVLKMFLASLPMDQKRIRLTGQYLGLGTFRGSLRNLTQWLTSWFS